VLEFRGLKGLDRAGGHVTRVHRAGHGEGLQAPPGQLPLVLVVDAQVGLLGRLARLGVATQAGRELGPALLDPLPQLRVLGDDAPAQVGAVGDVAALVALGELDPGLQAGQLAQALEGLVPAGVAGDRPTPSISWL
jgi:hypothetical protein